MNILILSGSPRKGGNTDIMNIEDYREYCQYTKTKKK